METARDVLRCRVATRRALTIARGARAELDGALEPLEDELRWLAAQLKAVRDLDVLLEHLRPQVETLGDDSDGAKLLTAALERQRIFRGRELKAAVGSERFDALLASLDGVGALVPADGAPAKPAAREFRKLVKAARRLSDEPADEELYDLRKRVKRARYAAELVGSAKAARLVRALRRVQDLTGAHQDAVEAEERLRSLSRPKTALAVGRLIERERLRKRAQRAALPEALERALRAGRDCF